MNEHLTWQARYDGLRADLARIGGTLGDKGASFEERTAAGGEFIIVWRTLCQHIKQRPTGVGHALTGG